MPIREVPMSERCKRDVCIREVSALETFVLERCLYSRDVCIREMSILERDVCIREMSVLERCLY